MKTMPPTVAVLLSVALLAGCRPIAPFLPLSQNLMVTPSENVPFFEQFVETSSGAFFDEDICAPTDIDCMLAEGAIVQLIAMCEPPHSIPGGDDDCIGTYVYEDWILAPLSSLTAYHQGDGAFEVTLFRDDGTSEVLFSATGVYTSETITLAPTGIVSMTVQSTGPWTVDLIRRSK